MASPPLHSADCNRHIRNDVPTCCPRTHPLTATRCPSPAQGDFKYEPKASAEGRMWTPGAVDFFRILNEQAGACVEGGGGCYQASQPSCFLEQLRNAAERAPVLARGAGGGGGWRQP